MRQKERSRRIALSYLKDKYKTILAYVFIVAVFFMVAFLYGYEQIYVDMLYAVLLALFFGGKLIGLFRGRTYIAEIIGGCVLILIGLKLLLESLLA